MTTACRSPSVAAHAHNNRWLVVIGGGDKIMNECFSRVEILDTTESRQWYHAASLPQPLMCALPAIIGNMCYLLGGYTEEDIQCQVHIVSSKKVFSVCLDELISEAISQSASATPTPSPWWPLPDTPLEKSTGLAFKGGLLAVGGTMGTSSSPSCSYYYQPTSRSWTEIDDNGELPYSQCGCTCAALPGGDLFIAGGVGAEQQVVILSEN